MDSIHMQYHLFTHYHCYWLIGVFIVTCMCYLALFLRCVILYLVVRSLYKYAAVVPLNC